jgi:hypothetical protein
MKLEVLIVRLTKKITTTKRVIRELQNDETGEIVEMKLMKIQLLIAASQLINVNIFSFAYGKLREKLSIILVKII